MIKIALVHGPNLNLLGQRNPEVYGNLTLEKLEAAVAERAAERGAEVEAFQSNHEGELIDALHAAGKSCQGIIFNPGGFSHTSVALRDAVEASRIPVIEVHISNIHGREHFRRTSLTAAAAQACISGMGLQGYLSALEALLDS
jgi:3-dehydroquinate dehydratase-2